MWQKIKCWLRGHEFEPMCDYCRRLASKHRCPTECAVTGVRCEGNKKDNVKRCKHCGKVNKQLTLENQLKMAMNGLFEICNNPSPDFNRILYAREIWHKVKELEK